MKKQQRLKIGVLNLMHNKEESQKQFTKVLTQAYFPIELVFYYPKMHYQKRPVPQKLQRIAKPLNLEEVKQLDGFIVSGAPIEKKAFNEIWYMPELEALFDVLLENKIEQLYVCWGAMAALNYFYGIQKQMLPAKIFGIYQNTIYAPSKLLDKIMTGFLAPHARYAEMDHKQMSAQAELELLASDINGHLTLAEAVGQKQTFLFSHLEYDRDALLKEYYREITANPEYIERIPKPENYFRDSKNMVEPVFSWQRTQKTFYTNWLTRILMQKSLS
ncbi:homoserine O-acetyltransferase/O-succinyltransferase family protein [Liquorilactobacillus capillatus]|uniref:Serine O-acetyltransferase n=1 Tax=Liquorilactobacillus capillatus DSM 19910 TaxID=1423731 RepID=A0A0R1M7F9_9LACO|nr:homoserine O-succinyltransferase [Liquorilactobacillus capillatus]KRL00850.1 homoserine O-succinyltransferase [Liquorilactobacillus capillatus DSM 19910]